MSFKKCQGGPADGVEVPSPLPKGVIVVNKNANEVAVYDTTPAGINLFRGYAPLEWSEEAKKNIRRAADEPKYHVLTYDEERMGPWQR